MWVWGEGWQPVRRELGRGAPARDEDLEVEERRRHQQQDLDRRLEHRQVRDDLHPFLEVLRALGAERVLEQVIAGEQLELVVLDRGAEEDEEGVEERERPQPPDDDLREEVGGWMGLRRRRRRRRVAPAR